MDAVPLLAADAQRAQHEHEERAPPMVRPRHPSTAPMQSSLPRLHASIFYDGPELRRWVAAWLPGAPPALDALPAWIWEKASAQTASRGKVDLAYCGRFCVVCREVDAAAVLHFLTRAAAHPRLDIA